jgi:RNA polymerase sigma-70 factor (ECF subfamily)
VNCVEKGVLDTIGSVPSTELENEIAAVYQSCAADLLRFASSMAHNDEAGRDAVQEVFLRYFVERRYGRVIENPRAWLHQAARNHLLNRFKAAAAQYETSSDTLDSVPGAHPTPEQEFGRSELARDVAAALTPREYDCLRLRAEGFGYAEIAGMMNVRTGTVGALLARIAKKLCRPPFNRPDVLRGLVSEGS